MLYTKKSGVHYVERDVTGDNSEGSKELVSTIWSFLMAWLQIIITSVSLVLEIGIYIQIS